MHGPFQFIGTSLLYRIFGDGDTAARVLPALFGTALVGLPILFRGYLGRMGALATSLLLAFSPTMLYFSRFARNDIYIAVWTLALVALMWRYMDSRKPRYWCSRRSCWRSSFRPRRRHTSLSLYWGAIWFCSPRRMFFRGLPEGDRCGTFRRRGVPDRDGDTDDPLSGAATSILQGRLGLTLANGDPNVAAVGVPLGTGSTSPLC